jgi:hypothetical protein
MPVPENVAAAAAQAVMDARAAARDVGGELEKAEKAADQYEKPESDKAAQAAVAEKAAVAAEQKKQQAQQAAERARGTPDYKVAEKAAAIADRLAVAARGIASALAEKETARRAFEKEKDQPS